MRHLDVAGHGIAARVVALQQAAYALEAELIGFDGIPPLHDAQADVVAHEIEWLGAYTDGKLVGGIGFTRTGNATDIDRLFVDPAWSGRGVGRSLVEAVLDTPVVTVSTGTANEPARRLYESLGFKATGQREIAPGVTVTEYRLKRAAS